MCCCSCWCSARPSPARRRPMSSSTAGRCTRCVCIFTRQISASFASVISRTRTCRATSSGAASACATSACACAGWRRAARRSSALRIDFNRYVGEQAFLGMSALVLDNALKDPSFMRERTSMAFIKRMGQPAPRESFGRVYINGAYEGLYTFVETVDSVFLARELGDGLGYLFEHKYVGRLPRRVPRRRLRAVQAALRGADASAGKRLHAVRADSRAVPRSESGGRCWSGASASAGSSI